MTKSVWEPSTDIFADPPPTRSDKLFPWLLFGFIGLVGAICIGVFILSATHPQTSFSYRCTHKHGVVLDDQCVRKSAIIPNP